MAILRIVLIFLCLLGIAWIFLSTNTKSDPLPENAAQLGELLFFEKALSLDSSISCASCHKPEFAFADTVSFSKGVGSVLGLRNAPSVMNVAERRNFFFDGRAISLEDQVHFPIEDKLEMCLNYDTLVLRLIRSKFYMKSFQRIYNALPDRTNIAIAIAAYEKTLETSNTSFDAYMSDDTNAISNSAKRGRELFLSEKARCFDCHFGPDFTGDEFKNIGLYDGVKRTDKGRYNSSKDSSDIGKFKVPGLRNVGVTGPYMHDGSFKTLKEVIEYYSNPYALVANPVNMDSSLQKPIHFTEQEKTDLLNFLLTLTDRRFSNR